METRPTGIVELMLPQWLGDLAGASWQVLDILSEGHLMDRMSEFTLPDDAVRGFESAAAARRRRGNESPDGWRCGCGSTDGELRAVVIMDGGSTQARVRNKMRNNDLRFAFGHASVALRSPS